MADWLFFSAAMFTALFGAAYCLGSVLAAVEKFRINYEYMGMAYTRHAAVSLVVTLTALGIAASVFP
jgi:hypothetical protein